MNNSLVKDSVSVSEYFFRFKGMDGYLENLPIVEKFLTTHAKVLSIDFSIAIHEAVSNALMYGRGEYGRAKVKVYLKRKGHRLYARIISDNDGFDVLSRIQLVNERQRSNTWDLTETRGRGLPIMARLCSQVWFNGCGNQVLLVLDITNRDHCDEPEGCIIKSTESCKALSI